jgi:transcriptional regulator with XRE-family HTH domain
LLARQVVRGSNPVSDNKADGVDAVDSQPDNQSAEEPNETSAQSAADPLGADQAPAKAPIVSAHTDRSRTDAAIADAATEPAAKKRIAADPRSGPDAPPVTLGAFLAAIREKRDVSRDQLARQSHIPEHYVRMIESNEYSKISDQLYMVPFIRRYAVYFDLDPEEITMRFVGEVQRADNVPSARLDHPLDVDVRKRGGKRGGLLIVAMLAIMAGLYFYETGRHRQAAENTAPPAAQSATPAAVIPGEVH